MACLRGDALDQRGSGDSEMITDWSFLVGVIEAIYPWKRWLWVLLALGVVTPFAMLGLPGVPHARRLHLICIVVIAWTIGLLLLSSRRVTTLVSPHLQPLSTMRMLELVITLAFVGWWFVFPVLAITIVLGAD